MTERCALCPGRVCAMQSNGRIINDNPPGSPVTLENISISSRSIDNCSTRSVILADLNKQKADKEEIG